MTTLTVKLRRPHPEQARFIDSPAKRKVVRAGRRGGKTVGIATLAVKRFLAGRRQLYATPTQDQIGRFWFEVKRALEEPIEAGVLYKNETQHIIELPGTEQRIRAKTAWNADTLRGDYADDLYFDEWQLMNEGAWGDVGAPMLLDNNGDAVFIYTPPSLRSRSVTKADNPRHAAMLFKAAQGDTAGRWAAFHFASHANPYISKDALAEIARDMTRRSYQQEIEALDLDDVPGALWTQAGIDKTRVLQCPTQARIVVAVDPAASVGQTGIAVAGKGFVQGGAHLYILEDATTPEGSKPEVWAEAAVAAYHRWNADAIVGEVNNGGDMIESVIRTVPGGLRVNYKTVRATRGKYTRAEPISALWERGWAHIVGFWPDLEEQLTTWVPGNDSPNRLDAMVWAGTEMDIVMAVSWQDLAGLGKVDNFTNVWG